MWAAPTIDRPRRPRPLSSHPLDVVLHVGMGKSGTSSVQFFLRDNRDALSEQGVLYPRSPGGARHGQLSLFAKSPDELAQSPDWARRQETDPIAFRRRLRRRLSAEIDESGLSRVLLSDEVLFGLAPEALRRLRRLLGPTVRSLRVVAYLRRQDDHLVSRYQEGVKIGWVRRLDDWAQEDMSDLYDYAARLRLHQRVLAPDELVVRRFEPPRFDGGSLFQDFLDAAGIGVSADTLDQVPQRNVSLDAETVEFLRLVNLYRVEAEGAVPGVIDNRTLVARLSAGSDGPVLTLPAALLDRFMARWEETNRQVAADHFGESGPLFTVPRKTAGTTTEQRLDPGRLDDLFALSGLPEELRAPLRAIAEREAAAA